jgi:dynein heavy chain
VATATIDEASPVDRRFIRHFNVIYVNASYEQTLPLIISRILQAHVARYGAAVAPMYSKLATATVGVLKAVQDTLRPTVSSPHYIWTTNDAFRVVRGLLAAPVGQTQFATRPDFARLWLHEAFRIFGDRLNSEADRAALREILLSQAAHNFDPVDDWDPARQPAIPLIGEAGAPYGEIADTAKLLDAVQAQLADFNAAAKAPMELHIFAEAAEHVIRIARVLRVAGGGGHALLLGMSGSGRQSLSRLAASMADVELFEQQKVRHYGISEWGDDLRRAINAAGLQQRSVALLLRADTLSDAFLADVAELLHSGVVASVFSREDRQSINQTLRALETRDALARMPANTTEHMFDRFAARARTNLHVILCMSPYNRSFRTRLRMFPSLVTSCSCVDWFGPWTGDALDVIGRASLAAFELGENMQAESVAAVCVALHRGTETIAAHFEREERRSLVVPSSRFLDFLRQFKSLMGTRRGELTEESRKLEGGIAKLNEAAEIAARDQKMLEELLPVLEHTSKEVAELMATLSVSRDEADAMRDKM